MPLAVQPTQRAALAVPTVEEEPVVVLVRAVKSDWGVRPASEAATVWVEPWV